MSQELISLNPDLKRLRDEGYEVEVRSAYLLVHSVPYLNSSQQVCRGTLVSSLDLAGDHTVRPSTHVVFFIGDHPCAKGGKQMSQISHTTVNQTLAPGLTVNHSFSNKPAAGYADFYEKMSTYVDVISAPARSLEPTASARTFRVMESDDASSVFHYVDTASSRAGIKAISDKLALQKVGIVGLGGTGSYVLDLVAKTSVAEVHLFDADRFYSHNAFRSPGAASLDELRASPKKVHHFAAIYSRMRKGIIPHDVYINDSSVQLLRELSFVFLCVDANGAKELMVRFLEERGTPFVDVGMDVIAIDEQLTLLGDVRVTASTPMKRDHLRKRVSFHEAVDGDYERNIQIADLNALNAALAVIKWKKIAGFYQDLEREHQSIYSVNVNMLRSEDLIQ